MTKLKELGLEMAQRVSARKARKAQNLEAQAVQEGAMLSSRAGEPRLFVGDGARSVGGSRGAAAAKLYARHARPLGLPPSMKALGRATVHVKDRAVQFLSFKPRVEGLEVDGGHVAMGLAYSRRTGKSRLIGLKSDARLDRPVAGSFRMRRAEAVSAAARSIGVRVAKRDISRALRRGRVRVEKVLAEKGGTLRRAFRVTPRGVISSGLQERFGHRACAVVVDAETGERLRMRPTVIGLTGHASAFDESPITSPRNIDRTSLIVDGRSAHILATDGEPHTLRNEDFDVVPGEMEAFGDLVCVFERKGARATGEGAGGLDFLYEYNDYPHISEANAFVHLNRIRGMLLRVSPTFTRQTTAPHGKPLTVYVDIPASEFNAFSTSGGELWFLSNGGVDAAVDSNIIAHEYGHQVHFVLAPNAEEPEVLEAVADFIAGVYTHDTTISELYPNRELVTSGEILDPEFSPGPYTGLREIYNDYRYPEDYTGKDFYQRSLILSGALMELHLDWFSRRGGENYHLVPKVLLGALSLLPAEGKILDMAVSIEMAALIMAFSGEPDAGGLFTDMVRIFRRRGLV